MRSVLVVLILVAGGGYTHPASSQELTEQQLAEESGDSVVPTRDDFVEALRLQSSRAEALRAIPRIERAVFGPGNSPRRIEGELGLRLSSRLDAADLSSLFEWLRPLYGFQGTETFELVHVERDFPEVWAARLEQKVVGIPVANSWLNILWRKDTGELVSVDGSLLSDRKLPIRACNSVGCSGWRGPRKVPYTTTCP